MKHIFIYNPMAGKNNKAAMDRLRHKMRESYSHLSYEFYPTLAPKDATVYVKKRCSEEPDTPLRFYACGGDGTANEVLHGIVGFPNASMTCYPCGSGNDFVKYYGGADRFLDIDALVGGTEQPIDIMRIGDRYSLNVTNFGFDGAVAKTMIEVKHKKFIGGKNAYTTGIVKALFTSMRNRCTVWVDGEQINNGKMLLCTVSNGKYVGGAYCCAPHSDNTDGLLEVCLVKPINHITFLSLINAYKEGRHLDDARFAKLLAYRRGKVVHVEAPEGFYYSLDGEIVEGSDFDIEICPAAIQFAVPAVNSAETVSENTEEKAAEAAVV